MADVFKQDEAGIRALLNGPEVAAVLTTIAEKGKAIAIGLSTEFVDTGEYIASFNVRTETVRLPFSTTRSPAHEVVAAILENTADHAAAVEYGNRRDPKAHHVLGQTLDALGRE